MSALLLSAHFGRDYIMPTCFTTFCLDFHSLHDKTTLFLWSFGDWLPSDMDSFQKKKALKLLKNYIFHKKH